MKEVLKDRLLVEKLETKTNSILDIKEDENEPLTGVVLLKGKHVEDVAVGDIIRYYKSDAEPITTIGKNLFILREFNIIGIN